VLDGGEDKHDSDIRNLGVMITEDYVKEEAEWLKEVVKSEEFRNAKTRIVFCHMDPLTNGWHGQTTIDKYLVPILNEAGVDVMLCGHIHKFRYDEPGTKSSAKFPVICNPNLKRMDATVTAENIKFEFVDQEKVVKTINIEPGQYKK
jgi:Icc-related predicted phosphoesterase